MAATETVTHEATKLTSVSDTRPHQVCLITTEFHGLFKNGGIGTANTGLAYALCDAGFNVTVAFADADESGPRVKQGNFSELQESYRQVGITLDYVPAGRAIQKAFDDPRSASYSIYLYLKRHSFDTVYFNDCGGQGFYSLLAKQAGVYSNAPRMYVVAHGPQEWVLALNSLRYWDRVPVITSYMERRSAALADALISPSRYLVDWMISRNWTMPAEVLVLQNVVRLPKSFASSTVWTSSVKIQEIVFFGRLEVRKGIELFCDAISLLSQSVDLSGVKVTFLGKFSHVAGLHSGMYVVERARRWRSSLRLLSTYGQDEALAYLCRSGRLAVIPSHAENSPCVVAECLQLGVPFVSTDSGGTRELVAAEDRDRCLIAPSAEALTAKLDLVLKEGQRPARLAISQAECVTEWLHVTNSGATARKDQFVSSAQKPVSEAGQNSTAARPIVSVCLTALSLTAAAEAFIESLLQQDYPNLQVVLLDDGAAGSRRDATLAAIQSAGRQGDIRILPTTENDRGVQRNVAAAQANGDYLLFAEEDSVVLEPECISTLVTAALRMDTEIVTALPLMFRGRSFDAAKGSLDYFPIGSCAELGALENCFGGGVLLVARGAFDRYGDGFPMSYDIEICDWLFLASTTLAGLRLEVVPKPLFGYRMRPPSELDSARTVDNHRRILAVYNMQKLDMFERTIESVVQRHRASGARQWHLLEDAHGETLEIAQRLSSLESNSDEALRGFVNFCIERHRVDEALDFALYNNRSLLSDVIGAAKMVAESQAFDAVRRNPLEFWHEISLTAEVRERIKSVSASSAKDFAQPGKVLAAHAIETGITILKAAAVCPGETLAVRAFAAVEAVGQMPVSLALVAAAPNAQLRLTERGLQSSSVFWWSNWISWTPAKAGERLEVPVAVRDRFEGLLDLHFLTKVGDDGARPAGRIVWESVAATIVVNGAITTSAIDVGEVATPVPREIIDEGVLLTENTEFPFPVFVPGEKTLLHPLPGRIVLARLGGAVPEGSRGVRSVVSIELANAHPVQFAVWLRLSSRPVKNETEFTVADAFSGWFSVRDTFRSHSFTVNLPEPATGQMDIYLATRVVEFPDVHYCHAVWHKFLVLE